MGRARSNAFLLKASLSPQLFYPAPVFGMSTGKVRNEMSSFAAHLTCWRPGNSSTMALMLAGLGKLDPIYPATLLPVLSWAKKVRGVVYSLAAMDES